MVNQPHNRTAVIDTNLILLVMFAANNRNPANDTRLSRYSGIDLKTIQNLISNFKSLIVTPNILTETSNLLKGFYEHQWLREFISQIAETYIPSNVVVEEQFFNILGLSDASFFGDEFSGCYIVTDDQPLSNYLASRGRPCIYYSDYRASVIQSQ